MKSIVNIKSSMVYYNTQLQQTQKSKQTNGSDMIFIVFIYYTPKII